MMFKGIQKIKKYENLNLSVKQKKNHSNLDYTKKKKHSHRVYFVCSIPNQLW